MIRRRVIVSLNGQQFGVYGYYTPASVGKPSIFAANHVTGLAGADVARLLLTYSQDEIDAVAKRELEEELAYAELEQQITDNAARVAAGR